MGENVTKDVLRYGKDEKNIKNFIKDNLLLVKFSDIIQEAKLPNAKNNNKKNYNKFNKILMILLKGFKLIKAVIV